VIYANHGLRASIRAMDEAFQSIYQTGSTAAVEEKIASLQEVFEIQGMVDMREDERKFSKRESVQAIVPAAGDHRFQPDLSELLKDRPLCMLEIGGKTIIERQMDLLRSAGVTDICVVGGYLHEKIKAEGASLLYNSDYATRHDAHSIMFAKDHFKSKTVMVYSDVLFDRQILDRLIDSPHQVTLVIDRAYQTLPFREKKLDLVVVEDPARGHTSRRLTLNTFKPIRLIGKQIDKHEANYEFIGMAFFREEGIKELKRAWEEVFIKFRGRSFYEALSVDQASFTDLVQYLIDRGYPVYGMEIEHGWSEIHSLDDYERLNAYFKSP